MNRERRKAITELADRISKWAEEVEAFQAEIEAIAEEEQEYLDNMPENLHGSERYYASEEAIRQLEEAGESFGDFDCVFGALEAAKE